MTVEQIALTHFKYIDQIDQFIHDSGPEPEVSSPEDCALGKWLQENPVSEIAERHVEFHRITDEAIAAKKRGDVDEASKLLDEAYLLFARIAKVLYEY